MLERLSAYIENKARTSYLVLTRPNAYLSIVWESKPGEIFEKIAWVVEKSKIFLILALVHPETNKSVINYMHLRCISRRMLRLTNYREGFW